MKLEETKEIKDILPFYFHSCVNTLEKHRKLGHFSAWSVGNREYLISLYHADEALVHPKNNLHPYFDLASLTKPFFINTLLRYHWGENFEAFVTQPFHQFKWCKTDWNQELLDFIESNQMLSWNTFLSHKSDFDAWTWCKFFISVRQKKNIKDDFFHFLKKHYKSKNAPVYSDLNYMFLALLMESLFNNISWDEQIKILNESQKTHFFHASITPENTKQAIPSYPYLSIESNHHILSEKESLGFVHDTNANLFALLNPCDRIVSGHAGFYGTIADICKGIVTLQHTQPKNAQKYINDKFIYGLEQMKSLSADQSQHALGHFGYTGTSFWFEPIKTKEHKSPFILLTNRTSHRKSESNSVPLALVITDLKTDQTHQFLIHDNSIQMLSEAQFLNKIGEYFYKMEKICDNSIILDYYNMTELRKTLAAQIS